jgi:hypothetical protein
VSPDWINEYVYSMIFRTVTDYAPVNSSISSLLADSIVLLIVFMVSWRPTVQPRRAHDMRLLSSKVTSS